METTKINGITYYKYIADKDYPSVYVFLKENNFSENFITNLRKKEGYILLNDKIAHTTTHVEKGAQLWLCSNPNPKTTIMHCIIPLDIVYEDAYYLLVCKPSGLSCMPNRSHYSNNLAGAICHYLQKENKNFTLRIINRLDKDTCGLILIAKDSIAAKELKDFQKTYYAICEGEIKSPITINLPILTINQNGINCQKRVVSPDGQSATTMITPIKTLKNNNTLLSINLLHGRTHQIRVHLSHIKHSLIGDEIYGSKSKLIDHTVLICKEISFFHPFIKKTLHFTVPFPKDIEDLIT